MESQLDIIKEKLNNIEATSNRSSIRKTLDDAIKTMAIRETRTRQLTVTIRTDELMKGDQLMQQINENFRVTLPTQNWEDKSHLYLRFSHSSDLDKFARDVTKPNNEPLTSIGKRIDKDSKGSIITLTRKPIKMEITNVKDHVKLDDIKKAFEKLDTGLAEITDLKEGKMVERTKSRYVSFKANAEAFSLIYKNLDGIITTTRTRLYPKINAKPYLCRECFNLSPKHQCRGKTCNNCGSNDHKGNECKKETKFCNNCKISGHRAKDNHCRKYLQEAVKELQKADIPTEFFNDSFHRTLLIKNMNI